MRALFPLVLLTLGCNETVAFLSIDLTIPSRSPALVCPADPRRASSVTISAACEQGEVSASYPVQEGTVSLGSVPLGSCTVEVKALNRYGNTVLSGSAVTEIKRGENPSLPLALLEERCENCDPDEDQLASSDEMAMKLDPGRPDSDGDGLSDGLEVLQCCTDPLNQQSEPCRLLIANVEPPMGIVGETVMIKASSPLVKPEVLLGGVPLDRPLSDSTVIFGKVGQGTILGEVQLTSGGTTDTFQDLFAVLRRDPELVADIDQLAGGTSTVMQELTDLAFRPGSSVLFLLGRAESSDGDAAVLIKLDVKKGSGERAVLSPSASPVALAISKNRLWVLLREGSDGMILAGWEAGAASKLPQRVIKLGIPDPVALVIEPSGEVAQILFKQALLRLPLQETPGKPGILVTADRFFGNAAEAAAAVSCTGLAYHEVENGTVGLTYLACNLPRCPIAGTCEPTGHVLRIGPVSDCLPLDGKTQPSLSCMVRYVDPSTGHVIGSPVIDSQQKQIYQLTTGGLAAMPFDEGSVPALPQLRPLPLLIQHTWQSQPAIARVMVQDPRGFLYAADGPRIWRLEPRQADPLRRQGRPFFFGEAAEVTTLISSEDGSMLAVGQRREGGFSTLLQVCSDRCKECLCDR